MTRFVKALAIIMLVCGIVASIYVANANPIIKTVNSDLLMKDIVTSKSFNVLLFLSGCILSLFPFGILYTIGSMHGLLEKIAEQTNQPVARVEKTGITTQKPDEQGEAPRHCTCKRCGMENKSSEMYCTGCGQKL